MRGGETWTVGRTGTTTETVSEETPVVKEPNRAFTPGGRRAGVRKGPSLVSGDGYRSPWRSHAPEGSVTGGYRRGPTGQGPRARTRRHRWPGRDPRDPDPRTGVDPVGVQEPERGGTRIVDRAPEGASRAVTSVPGTMSRASSQGVQHANGPGVELGSETRKLSATTGWG